ncbi:MAG: MBL fold metallo-hydrolase [Acidimicrobiia bacterium]
MHRGSVEIGGNCVEFDAADGRRLVVDVGRPLWASRDDVVELPAEVAGTDVSASTLCGVVISHPHLDHYGLADQLAPDVPVYIGREAASLLAAAAFFSPMTTAVNPTGYLAHGVPLEVGPFTVTPLLNDHSAFDAYSLVIGADGQRVFYTGDIRAHGRKRTLFEQLLASPPADVDVMLMEGTHVRADAAHDDADFETEDELERRLVGIVRDTPGAVALVGSAQNIDRLVTAYRAAKRTGRELVVDLYGASVAAATRASIPQLGFPGLRVYVPHRQRVLVKGSGEFDRVRQLGAARVYHEELAASPERFVYHVPSSVVHELIGREALRSPGLVLWSMWTGYLRDASGKRLEQRVRSAGLGFETLHTSGHASVKDLRRLVDAVKPTTLVPMHSEATDRFEELFPRVERHADGEWWSVEASATSR